jgi:hypothetical protein
MVQLVHKKWGKKAKVRTKWCLELHSQSLSQDLARDPTVMPHQTVVPHPRGLKSQHHSGTINLKF